MSYGMCPRRQHLKWFADTIGTIRTAQQQSL